MRLTAGLGGIKDFDLIAESKPDEVFVGFVPYEWNENNSEKLSLNRREVFFCHVQIGSMEDMRILYAKATKHKIDVAVTFNSLYYSPDKLSQIADMICSLRDIGYEKFIIADINLLRYLCAKKVNCNIHISGELGEMNSYTLKFLMKHFSNDVTRITRIIFPRSISIAGMRSCIDTALKCGYKLEYETFFLNEFCRYSGGFCNSIHCDEMEHICRLDYKKVPLVRGLEDEMDTLSYKGESVGESDCCTENLPDNFDSNEEDYIPGMSGCGMCALKDLQNIGITHLKIVGRGESAEYMHKDIQAARKAVELVDSDDYVNTMKSVLFTNGCGGNCYYQLQ